LEKRLTELENTLEEAMKKEASLRNMNENVGFIASAGSDCAEVKRIEAELLVLAEGRNDTERKAWLTRQRKENQELAAAVQKQRATAFSVDSCRVDVEMAKKRLESVKVVLALKTAQINFLAG
ncbi:MAG: hypothetical protein KKD44_26770, partial [Proteobacteria bacterium]|nr:hypothetical protein [Pseudomonadota bacterium]